jgi:hypothetical protein
MKRAQAVTVSVAASAIFAACLSALGATEARRPSIAVIVHPGVPNDDLDLGELRKIFLADRQFWSRDSPVTLLVPAPGSPERAALLARIYEKSERQYRHYWIAKVFGSEVASAPRVASGRLAADLVRGIAGSITVVEASRVPPGVKVLKIGGKRLDDRDYPLR